MSKKKFTKTPRTDSTNPVGNKTSSKKWLWALLALLLATAGWFWYNKKTATPRPGGEAAGVKITHEVEETLKASNPLLELMDAAQTGIDFQNQIIETESSNILNNINAYNGGGVAVADINNDKLPDIYFVCSNGKNRMYLNEGNFRFRDITDQSGLASEEGFETAVTAADVNADGYLDFYVCRGGPLENDARRNKLYINNGAAANGLTFTERSKEYGLDDMSASTGAAFFDSDNDGDLDLYLLNYPTDLSYSSKLDVKPGPDGRPMPNLEPKKPLDSDRFYRNDKGKFVDVSKEAGIWNFAYGLSVSVSDINRDGFVDVYVGNDFIQPDRLYINNKKGGFNDQLAAYFKHCGLSTMGTELTDFDNDGLVDLYTVDMLPGDYYRQKTLQNTNAQSKYLSMIQNGYFEAVTRNILHRNNGNGSFSDLACMTGTYQTDWSWSGLLADLDNNGRKDLHVTNGYRREITNRDFIDFYLGQLNQNAQKSASSKQDYIKRLLDEVPTYKPNNRVFENNGNWAFSDKSGDWMTMKGSWSCGAAWADFDADGDLDLVVNNLEDPAFLYKNLSRDQNKGNFLQIKLEGSPANPFAVGASVQISSAGDLQYQELQPNHGIFSSVEHLIHFGLGAATQVDQVKLRWPDGKTQNLQNVQANQRLTLRHSEASGYVAYLEPFSSEKTLLQEVNSLDFTHRENPYNDYEQFPLNLWKSSELGPMIATGDANGDGLDDIFIGNGFEAAGGVFLQGAGGTFKKTAAACWENDKRYEDHGAVFFDSDKDNDLDLFVLSGGAEATNPIAWQCRLYENTDGKGNFKASAKQAVPVLKDVAQRVVAHDFDNDGDQDLILGGRVTPGKWPLTPATHIFRNHGAYFEDATNSIGEALKNCGMVSDLAWADLNGDQQKELLLCGEWMPISVFSFNGQQFVNESAKYGFDKSDGFWNRLALADLDGDGDQDIAAGNLGLNTRFTASAEAPVRCFAWDFDKNNVLDPIVAIDDKGKLRPWPLKDVLNKHIPGLKKKILYADAYGRATVSDLFPQSELDQALNLYAYVLESSWWENQNGRFVRHSLPRQAQTAPAYGIVAEDFNGDGRKDLLLAGNKYGMEVELGRCDAGIGMLLLNDGKGNFNWTDCRKSGFFADKEVRDLVCLRSAGTNKIIVAANNNAKAQVWKQ